MASTKNYRPRRKAPRSTSIKDYRTRLASLIGREADREMSLGRKPTEQPASRGPDNCAGR